MSHKEPDSVYPDGFDYGDHRDTVVQPEPYDNHSVRPDDLLPRGPDPRDLDPRPLPPPPQSFRGAPGPGPEYDYDPRDGGPPRVQDIPRQPVMNDPFTDARMASEPVVDYVSDDDGPLGQPPVSRRPPPPVIRTRGPEGEEDGPVIHHPPVDSQARARAARRKQGAPYYPDESPSMLGTARMLQYLLLAILGVVAIFILVACCFVVWSRTHPYRVDLAETESWSGLAKRGKLDNGLKYVIVPNEHKAGRFTSYLRVEVGSLDESDSERGLAHVIEHMSFDNSKTYPGRGGVWDAMTSSGAASFNAFTSFRTTTYELWDLPATKVGLTKSMNLHLAQVYYSEPQQQYLDEEKGAILGEARMRNGSERLSTELVLKNHGGKSWVPPRRITIGLPSQIQTFNAGQITDFRKKWYRLDRFTLFIVGNVTVSEAEKSIKDAWGGLKLHDAQEKEPPAHEPLGDIKPESQIFLQELQGINGIELHLLCTRPYVPHPHTRNQMRRSILDRLFSTAFAFQTNIRLAELYPDTILYKFKGRKAGVKIENEFNLGVHAHIMSIESPGHPHTGTWRRDFEVALTELRRIAEHGVHPALLRTMLSAARRLLLEKVAFGSHMDSKKIITEVMGDMDPDNAWMDPEQAAKIQLPLLDKTFEQSAQVYLQSAAQYMWKALVGILERKEYLRRPYNKFENPTATLQVLVGRSFIQRVEEAISIDDIRRVIFQALNARPPPPLSLDRMILGMMHGVSTGGISFSGIDAPTGIPEGGTLFSRKRLFERLTRMAHRERHDEKSGIMTYVLNNGVLVNVKPMGSGAEGLPRDSPGKVEMQLVSMGGRSTETPNLFGACKAVNEDYPAGFSAMYDRDVGRFQASDYDVETVKAYFHGSMPAKVECEEEFFIISKTLHGSCPEDSECDPLDHSYFKELEGVRLAMNPLYDSRSMKLAATAWDNRLEELLIEQDPQDNLEFHSMGAAWRRAYPNDTRLHEPKAQNIFALDPLSVQQWVREQFTPDRIEINVVGDFKVEHLIIQLNMVLGTLPNSSYVADPSQARLTNLTARVGYDPYSSNVAPFQRGVPATPVTTTCNLPSIVPDRGYATSIAAASNFQQIGTKRFAVEKIFKERLFETLRRDNGMTYLLQARTHFPLLFPNFGHIAVTWAPGNWPVFKPNAANTVAQNLADSANLVDGVFKGTFTKALFNKKMPQIVNNLETELEDVAAWFVIMRGLSLRPPTIWPQPHPPFVKHINNTDVLPLVKKLSYDDLKDAVATPAKKGAFIKAQLQTVGVDQPDTCASLV